MRISDWSSDVCSSDLFNFRITSGNPFLEPYRATTFDLADEWYFAPGAIASVALFAKDIESFPLSDSFQGTYADSGLPLALLTPRSEEHTSELQLLIRISYAAVCLKKQNIYEFTTIISHD